MPRPIPPPLAVALSALRAAYGWKQGELGVALGLPLGNVLCDIEKGRRTIKREKLDELIAPLNPDPEAVEVTLFWLEALYGEVPTAPGSPFELPENERRLIKRLGVDAAQVAFRESVTLVAEARRRARVSRARGRARASLDRLLSVEPGRQRLLVEGTTEYRSFALCELVCERSVEAAPRSGARALALAELALFVAERAEESEAWRACIQGYAWAFVGNARRVAEDLAGAEEAFRRSRALWEAGAAADPGILDASRVLDLEASFLRDRRRFAEALVLLDQAVRLSPSAERTASILLNRSALCEQMGDCEGSVAALRAAAPLVGARSDSRQLWLLRFNLGVNLCHLGRHAEALPLAAEARALAVSLRNESDLQRVLWLDARIAAGLGRRDEAIAALRQVRDDFAARGLSYDAALATLDLAVLLLEEGENAEVRALAGGLVAIFENLKVYREALAAVRLFRRAAENETATAKLGHRLVRYLERARHDPELRFERGATVKRPPHR